MFTRISSLLAATCRKRQSGYRYGPLAAAVVAVAVLWPAVMGCCSCCGPQSCPTELSQGPRSVSTYATVAARPTTGASIRRRFCARRPVRRASSDTEFEVRRQQFTARLAGLTDEMDVKETNATVMTAEKTSPGVQCRKIRYTTRTSSTKHWSPKIKKCFTFAQPTSPPQRSTAATSKATGAAATTKTTATAADPAADTTAGTTADTTAGRKKKKRKKTTATTVTTTTPTAAPEDPRTVEFTIVEEESSADDDDSDDATSADGRGDTEATDWDAKTTADDGTPGTVADDAADDDCVTTTTTTTTTKKRNTTRHRRKKTRRTTPDYY